MVDQFEAKLQNSQWLGGASPTGEDRDALVTLEGKAPNPLSHPRTFAWYSIASKFTPQAQAAWAGETAPVAAAEPKKKEAAAGGAAAGGDGEGKKKSKKEKKEGGLSQKELKKQERLRKKQEEEAKKNQFVKDPNDPCADKFGEMELIRSQCDPELRFQRKYVALKDLADEHAGQTVRVRARISTSRAKGKMCFLVVRESFATAQAVLFVSELNSKGMVTFASKIPRESIVEIVAEATKPDQPIPSVSQQVELQVREIWLVNKSVPILPFQIEDASRVVLDQTAEDSKPGAEEEKKEDGDKDKMPVVKQDVRLNNRIIDLRVPTNQAIMRVQSAVCQLYREFMLDNGFVEIHTPKLIGGASEGGANVFQLKYFNQDACLAQSPQLYKQMALCGDLQRVFEIGPVFRAENSNTNRHLCEFTGLDMEMEFKNHYFEVLDVLSSALIYIFKGLESRFSRELKVINDQYPFEPFKCADPIVKVDFKDGIKMLQEAGIDQAPLDDLSTETEKALGKLVKEKFDTDFYMLYGYPANARPFYTMLDPHDPNYTNSYDFFMRGEEITSGAQRIHDPAMLTERAKHFDIPVETLKDYIDSFKYGAPTHGGAGFGLERIVKFYCNLHNIRKASLFPRDPQRLAP